MKWSAILLVILLFACRETNPRQSEGVSDEPTQQAEKLAPTPSPSATHLETFESEATATPTQISATPTPTPYKVRFTCPPDRDREGQFYYEPDKESESEAIERRCGTLAPVERTCPEARLHKGAIYPFDPDGEMSLGEALDEHCGKTLAEVLASCTVVDSTSIKQILKGTQSIIGNCYTVGVHVWQFDSNTGPCSFIGSISDRRNSGLNFDNLSQFGYGDMPEFQSFPTHCPELDNVFSGDSLVADVFYLGGYSYATQRGGYNTVPAFEIIRARE